MIGSLMALGWAIFGSKAFGPIARYALLAASAVLTAILLRASIAMQRYAHAMPRPDMPQATANKRAWRLFWLNFFGEIILLNAAAYLLGATGSLAYLIPAISAVVGLHFWPMAHFFRVRSYWWVGHAMIAGAAVAALFIRLAPGNAVLIVHLEALANAAILWSALGYGAASSIKNTTSPRA